MKYTVGHFLGLLICTIIVLISSIIKVIIYLKILDENKKY